MPALFKWVHFRRVRWEIFKKQASFGGLLLEVLCDEIRCVIQDDHELLSELFLNCSQKVRGNLSGERRFNEGDEAATVVGDRAQQIDRGSPARDCRSWAEVHRKQLRFCSVLITCVF